MTTKAEKRTQNAKTVLEAASVAGTTVLGALDWTTKHVGLVKEFLDVMGGDIRISSKTIEESPDNHGTTVFLILKKA